MDRKSVNYIKAIAEMRSISAAAESLGISQPALSSHLKKIEGEIGAVLFDRSRQPLELTEAGHAYLDYLDRTRSLEKELEQTLSDIEGLETGSVTVGGAAFFNVAYLPQAVGTFAKEFPGVDIDIVDGNVPFLTTEALKGRLDLFITPSADDPDRFVYEKLLEEKVCLAVPADWEINEELGGTGGNKEGAGISAEQFRKLCNCPFIMLREDQYIGQMMERLFEKYGCRPKKVMRVEQTITSLALTMTGVGVSLVSESSLTTGGLARLPKLYMADEEICRRSVYVAYPRNKYLSKAASEFIRTLKEANAKAAEPQQRRDFAPSIVENLARNSVKNPDKLCLADAGRSVTYKEAWDTICGLAMELDRRGVSKGSRVVIECDQSVDYMLWILAIQLLRAISVPLEKNAAVGRIVEIAVESEAVLHIGAREIEELTLPHLDIGSASAFALGQIIDGVYRGPIEDLDLIEFPKSEDVAEILFSTGTTGKSKGIVLTHRNDVALAENVCVGVRMKPDNVELIPMPTSHSHGLRRTYGNLANGSSVVFADNIMLLKNVFKLMDEYHVTSMDLSPSMLSIFFKLSKDRLGDYADVLDYIQLGSAPLSEEDKAHLSRILPKTRLYNFYGSTEAGCSCLMDFNADGAGSGSNTTENSKRPAGCIGRPAVNAEFIVVDENRNPIKSSRDNLGFLASRGAINMKEYFKAPELTASATDGEYIYTKDLGYIDEDGYVYMLGRKDDVINFGGVKISPEEIESQVIKNEIVRDCACVPMDDPMTGQAPKLFIALEPDAEYDAKAFKSFLTEVLDANKQPKIVQIIDCIPRTFNGKIKRNELMEL